ncbi:hypothetical protein AVEN_173209-1 [Araneus ventricosus]|uniref:Uncharacterized protein n=1 Tax=Araneus ventricosus TaxID=182803 RepID=A0A4Y2JIH4_ARAVE|nr:hypothetical protein AVEN_173209-1 [Araneus ventricosus]
MAPSLHSSPSPPHPPPLIELIFHRKNRTHSKQATSTLFEFLARRAKNIVCYCRRGKVSALALATKQEQTTNTNTPGSS